MRKKNTTVSEAEIMKFVKNQDEAWQRQFVARQARRNDPANAERLEKVRSRLEAMRASWETMRDKNELQRCEHTQYQFRSRSDQR